MMNFSKIKTIDDLAECMAVDGKKYDRDRMMPVTVNEVGIRKQFSQIRKDTHRIYYLEANTNPNYLGGVEFLAKNMVFDRDGNKVEEKG